MSQGTSLDLRIPMGLMFTLTGTILFAFGLATRENTALYVKSLGINANLWWGLVLLIFGIMMLTLGRRNQVRMLREDGPGSDNRDQGAERNERPRGH
ncbi:MAG TPA: hypothetical protein VFB43_11850 [Terracidiphilus sp.]|nr:hypothetical protein [Terracidiphilus sp.]